MFFLFAFDLVIFLYAPFKHFDNYVDNFQICKVFTLLFFSTSHAECVIFGFHLSSLSRLCMVNSFSPAKKQKCAKDIEISLTNYDLFYFTQTDLAPGDVN